LHFLDVLPDIVHGNNDRRILIRSVIRFLEESAVDDAGFLRPAGPIDFACPYNYVILHLWAQHLRSPAKDSRIEVGHPLSVLCGHFKVDDRVHWRLLALEICGLNPPRWWQFLTLSH